MTRPLLLTMLLAAACGIARAEEAPPPAAGPAEAPAAPAALREAMKGFKGYLVGRIVKKDETGVVMRVKAITLLTGCTAKSPGLLLGQDAPVRFATETDEAGRPRPRKGLVETVDALDDLPRVAFGGLGGGNAVITLAPGKGPKGLGKAVKMMATRMTMQVDGRKVQIGGDDEEEDEDDEDDGPLATARVRADEEGHLVMDRVMPGGQSYATWGAMPTLRIAGPPKPKRPKARPKEETDF